MPVRILGIDPGTNVLGFAVLEADKDRIHLLEMGVVTLAHVGDAHTIKLRHIFEQVQELIRRYSPDEMAIEAPFHGKNVQSMLKLGRAQGVAIAAGMVNGLSIAEYLPKRVKRAITGNGNASKHQVAGMLGNLLHRTFEEQYFDATDALAVAVCHWFQRSSLEHARRISGSWKSFLRENPDRIVSTQRGLQSKKLS
ncbi:MAG: crossover junction endodeoxyribonuclease RuvC [Saprospiraceae bacterium]|nr:crossover junction endodeoxyribonuclease RuvC [Saprospiraceae bacterium]MDW8484217.1 crossover junction endodeoxyribonuclease RuvC [Saprospiraceae bacterium]